MAPSIKVLVADTERLFAETTAVALRAQPGIHVVRSHPVMGVGAVKAAVAHRPHVAVIDYLLPGIANPAVIQALRAYSPQTKVVALVPRHGLDEDALLAVAAGAWGVAEKRIELGHLVAIVRAAARGISPEYHHGRFEQMHPTGDEHAVVQALPRLTPRELEVLGWLSRGATAGEIATGLGISAATVKHHVSAILAGTGARSQVEAVAIARRRHLTAGPRPAVEEGRGPDNDGSWPGPATGLAPAVGDVTVQVADGERLFAQALVTALRAQAGLAVVCDPDTNAHDAVRGVARHHPDVAVVDDSIGWAPEDHDACAHHAADATRAMLDASPDTKMIVLSRRPDARRVSVALESGAVGYLGRDIGIDALVRAVRSAAAGSPLVRGEALAGMVDMAASREEERARQRDRFSTLTAREAEILEMLYEGRTTKEIARLWGVTTPTVKKHIERVLAKTGTGTQLEVLAMAQGAGVLGAESFRRMAPPPPDPPHATDEK